MEKKIFKLSNGNQIIFVKNPPFSFWTVNYAKGGLPKQLEGMYTHFEKIFNVTQAYLNTKGVSIQEEVQWQDQPEQS